MATVKYLLFAAIIAGLLFFASKIIIIFVPFLIGFVLAKASRMIADAILNVSSRRKRKKNKDRGYVPAPATKKPNALIRFFFPAVGEKKYSQRTRVTLLVYVLLLVLVFAGMIWAIGALIIQISNALDYVKSLTASMTENNTSLSQMASDAVENALSYLSRFFGESTIQTIRENAYSFVDNIGTYAFQIFEHVAGSLLDFVGNLPMIIFYIIAVIMSGYYFITDSHSMMRFFANNIKIQRFRMRTLRLLDPAVLDFMPVLGISATMLPMTVYVAINGDIRAMIILIIGMALMTVIRQTIEPRILGKSLNLHPLATILGMIIGVYVWGALGFLLGPVVMIIIIHTMKVFSWDKKMRRFIAQILHRISESDDEEDKKNVGKEPKEPDEKNDGDRPTLSEVFKESKAMINSRRSRAGKTRKTVRKEASGAAAADDSTETDAEAEK